MPVNGGVCNLECRLGFNNLLSSNVKAKQNTTIITPDGGLSWCAYQYNSDDIFEYKGGEAINVPEFNVLLDVGKKTIISVCGSYKNHYALDALIEFLKDNLPKSQLKEIELLVGGLYDEIITGEEFVSIPCKIYNGIIGVKYNLPKKITLKEGNKYKTYNNLKIKSFWKVKPEIKVFSGDTNTQSGVIGEYICADEKEQSSNEINPLSSKGCVYTIASRGTLGFELYSKDKFIKELSGTVEVEESVCKLVTISMRAEQKSSADDRKIYENDDIIQFNYINEIIVNE